MNEASGGRRPPPPAPPPPTWGQPPPPARARSGSPWGWLALGCGVVLLALFALMLILPLLSLGMGLSTTAATPFAGNVAIIDISGSIQSGTGSLFAPGANSEPLMRDLRAAGESFSVKAVVLNINSGGGSPAASQAVAEEVWRLRTENGKKVVAAMGDVAASGAYYIAAQADRIVANPSTLTGSIGVRTGDLLRIHELAHRYGVEGGALTTGPYKDTGSPWRPLRPDERELLQAMLQDIHEQFIADVARGRDLPIEEIRKLADGRVLTGRQALAQGLVDELGNLHDAIEVAGDLAGLARTRPFKMRRTTGLEGFFGEMSAHAIEAMAQAAWRSGWTPALLWQTWAPRLEGAAAMGESGSP